MQGNTSVNTVQLPILMFHKIEVINSTRGKITRYMKICQLHQSFPN